MTEKQSWFVHARHRGLQFQVIPSPNGATVIRRPRAPHLSDRGRTESIYVISVAAQAVQVLVPFLLRTFAIDRTEWDRRHAAFARLLADAFQPHEVAGYIRNRLGDSSIGVGIGGGITRDGSLLSVDPLSR